jgi:hydrogenase nickel incorporation protein HypA/HybF
MHEYSLVQALVDRVEEAVRERGAVAVHRVRVSVGELAGVDPDLLRKAYELGRVGTVCALAPLEVTSWPASWTCPRCRAPIPRGGVLRCAACGEPAHLDERSAALLLDALELEVP